MPFFASTMKLSNSKIFLFSIVFFLLPIFASASQINPLDPSDVNLNFLLTDHLGSTRVITDKEGKELQRFDYYPYGEEIQTPFPSPSSSPSPVATESHKFTGKERDATTGLDYFGARYLASNLGKWISVDPIQDGWNRYGYVAGNPINGRDLNGNELFLSGSKRKVEYLVGLLKSSGLSSDFINNIILKPLKGGVGIKLKNSGTNHYTEFLDQMLETIILSKETVGVNVISQEAEVAKLFILGGGALVAESERIESNISSTWSFFNGKNIYSENILLADGPYVNPYIGSYNIGPATILMHELGHVYASFLGFDTETEENIITNFEFAVTAERISNFKQGLGLARTSHFEGIDSLILQPKTAKAILKFLSKPSEFIENDLQISDMPKFKENLRHNIFKPE